jgi:hypothetical protein
MGVYLRETWVSVDIYVLVREHIEDCRVKKRRRNNELQAGTIVLRLGCQEAGTAWLMLCSNSSQGK